MSSTLEATSLESLMRLREHRAAVDRAHEGVLTALVSMPSGHAGLWSSRAQRRYAEQLDELRAEFESASRALRVAARSIDLSLDSIAVGGSAVG